MPGPTTCAEQLDALSHSTDLSRIGTDPTISEFWRIKIREARDRATQSATAIPSLGDVVRELGFGFSPLPDGMSLRQDPDLAMVLERRRQHTLPTLKQVRGTDLSKEQWEHLRALDALKAQELLEEYFDFLKRFRVRSDMSAARHYWYLTVVRRLIDTHLQGRPIHVLEIGAGAANLAVFLLSLRVVSSYTIVDLPEMLLNAGLQLRTYSPDAQLFMGPATSGAPSRRQPHVRLLTPAELEHVAPESVSLALNFNSFMEMDGGTRDAYLRHVYRTAMDGAVFYNVNRRQPSLPLADGGTYDNNPLLYPYDRRDEVVFWEDDAFQTMSRAWFGERPTLAVARAAIVRKPWSPVRWARGLRRRA